MKCIHCGGRVEWQGPLTNLTHTLCLSCGETNCQAPIEPDDDYCHTCGSDQMPMADNKCRDCGGDYYEMQELATECPHTNQVEAGRGSEGLGTIIFHWCPDCGALHKTMIDWAYTKYPWVKPKHR